MYILYIYDDDEMMMMILKLGVCLRDLDFKSNLELLIHLHIQVIYEYAE